MLGSIALVLNTTGYRIVGMLHILAVIVAFGPLFIYPSLQRGGASATVARLHLRLVLPALVLVWVLGMGLAGMSEGVLEVAQAWMVASIVGWLVLMAASWFLIRPALTDDGPDARSKMSAGIGVTHLVMVVVLYLMVFKPGL